jgi:hypothetical protein
MALLEMVYQALYGKSQRKMFFKAHVVHVDEGAVYGWSEEERQQNLQVVVDACEKYGFEKAGGRGFWGKILRFLVGFYWEIF